MISPAALKFPDPNVTLKVAWNGLQESNVIGTPVSHCGQPVLAMSPLAALMNQPDGLPVPRQYTVNAMLPVDGVGGPVHCTVSSSHQQKGAAALQPQVLAGGNNELLLTGTLLLMSKNVLPTCDMGQGDV